VKQVKWIGEERMIPSVGIGTKGKLLNMPTEMAISYIKQGLAEATNREVTNKPIKQVLKKEDK